MQAIAPDDVSTSTFISHFRRFVAKCSLTLNLLSNIVVVKYELTFGFLLLVLLRNPCV